MRTRPAGLRIFPEAHSSPERAPFPAVPWGPHRLPRHHVRFERPFFALFFTLLKSIREASRSVLLPGILPPEENRLDTLPASLRTWRAFCHVPTSLGTPSVKSGGR